jgi:FkbM family methyltransferase
MTNNTGFSTGTITFVHDNNVVMNYPTTTVGSVFASRVHAEKIFRTIITFMIDANLVRGNIIDAGCWIGDNALVWSKNIKNIVYAIDPSQENIEFVKTMIELNNITNIVTIQTALSDKNQIISTNDTPFLGPGGTNHCTFELHDKNAHKVQACSLDELYFNNQITNIGFIHLDVEGFESFVLHGSQTILSQYRPVVAFEQHLTTDDYVSLAEWFKSQEYLCVLIDETFKGTRKDCRNLLALPRENDYQSLLSRFKPQLIVL